MTDVILKATLEDLTPEQKEFMDNYIKDYTERCMTDPILSKMGEEEVSKICKSIIEGMVLDMIDHITIENYKAWMGIPPVMK